MKLGLILCVKCCFHSSNGTSCHRLNPQSVTWVGTKIQSLATHAIHTFFLQFSLFLRVLCLHLDWHQPPHNGFSCSLFSCFFMFCVFPTICPFSIPHLNPPPPTINCMQSSWSCETQTHHQRSRDTSHLKIHYPLVFKQNRKLRSKHNQNPLPVSPLCFDALLCTDWIKIIMQFNKDTSCKEFWTNNQLEAPVVKFQG